MENQSTIPAATERKKLFILFVLAQWFVVLWCAAVVLVHIQPAMHLNVPGASIPLFATSLAVSILVTGLHIPSVFFRLPKAVKIVAYISLLASLILAGASGVNVTESYEKTPAGAREKALREERERDEARKVAEAAAAAKAAEAAARMAEEEKLAKSREELRKTLDEAACQNLVSEVKSIFKNNGIKLIEINNVSIQDRMGSNVTCTANAITSAGDKYITFKTETTPQGNTLLKLDY